MLLEIYNFFLATFMKNNFSLKKLRKNFIKKFHKREKFLLGKLLPCLDYPYTLDHKEVLLTTPSKYKLHSLPEPFCITYQNFQFEEKKSYSRQKMFWRKVPKVKKKFSQHHKNFHRKKKLLIAK